MSCMLSSFQNFLSNISPNPRYLFQYYYAHANKNFNTDGAKHFEGDGKIYGGDPVLIRTQSQADAAQQQTAAATQSVQTKKITTFSWGDEEAKVKIYIDLGQFRGEITQEMISVNFEEYLCDIKIIDEEGTVNVLNLYK